MRYKCLLIRQNKYIIKEPDAQTQSRQACEKSQLVGYFLENTYSPMGSLLPPCYLCQRKRGKSFTFTFSGITHSRKSRIYTGNARVRHGIISTVPCSCCRRKWRCFYMGNPNLIPYETIVRATSGEPEAVDEVLRHYSKRIRFAALENGHVNTDTEDSIRQRLITALFQFRFD